MTVGGTLRQTCRCALCQNSEMDALPACPRTRPRPQPVIAIDRPGRAIGGANVRTAQHRRRVGSLMSSALPRATESMVLWRLADSCCNSGSDPDSDPWHTWLYAHFMYKVSSPNNVFLTDYGSEPLKVDGLTVFPNSVRSAFIVAIGCARVSSNNSNTNR